MRLTLLILILGLLSLGCGKKADEKSGDPSIGLTDQELLMKASKTLVQKFSSELKAELMAALSEGGPENAISVCQVKAPQIAAANSGEAWTIKRVTDRPRNPDNLANYHEMAVLVRFDDTSGNVPNYIFEWANTDSGKVYRNYRPIKIAPLCLKCHGTAEDIEPEVQAVLSDKYPKDRATGYRPDELRGMFVVEVRWPEGRERARALVAQGQ